jgi:hypothetical protein
LRARKKSQTPRGRLAVKIEIRFSEFYAALTTLPDFMQRVHTFIRPFPPAGS